MKSATGKYWIALLATLFMVTVLVLTACGDGSGDVTTPFTTTPGETEPIGSLPIRTEPPVYTPDTALPTEEPVHLHSFVEDSRTPAEHGKDGEIVWKCTCSKDHTEIYRETIPALPHSIQVEFTPPQRNDLGTYDNGYTTYKCTGCDYEEVYGEITNANYARLKFEIIEGTETCIITGIEVPLDELVIPPQLKSGRNMVTVVGIAKDAFVSPNVANTVSVTLPHTLKHIDEGAFKNMPILNHVYFAPESTLESVGKEAFAGCSKLKSIRLPASVKEIGELAFSGCVELTAFTIPETSKLETIGQRALVSTPITNLYFPSTLTSIGESAFAGCSSLRVVKFALTGKLETIPTAAFKGCTSLSGFLFPSYVVNVGEEAFYGCNYIQYLYFQSASKLETIGKRAFFKINVNELILPNGISSVGEEAFYGCESMLKLSIPASVTSIGKAAFAYASSLNDLFFRGNSTLTEIAEGAFAHSTHLYRVLIPATVSTIGDRAFTNSGLMVVYFASGSKLTTIGREAFSGCRSLASFPFSSTLTEIGEHAFFFAGLEMADFSQVTAPLVIKSYAFNKCEKLMEVVFPASLVKIEGDAALGVESGCAFGNCTSLQKVTFQTGGNLVIGSRTFLLCENLTEVILPDDLQEVGEAAFFRCNKLTTVTYNGNFANIIVGAKNEALTGAN